MRSTSHRPSARSQAHRESSTSARASSVASTSARSVTTSGASAKVYEDVLDLCVLIHSVHAQFTAQARHLVAAKRRLGVNGVVAVDRDGARLDGLGDADRAADVTSPDAAGE